MGAECSSSCRESKMVRLAAVILICSLTLLASTTMAVPAPAQNPQTTKATDPDFGITTRLKRADRRPQIVFTGPYRDNAPRQQYTGGYTIQQVHLAIQQQQNGRGRCTEGIC